MDKVLKAADDIAAVFNVTQEWLEPGRAAVIKILKELVEEKFTPTNNSRDEIAAWLNHCKLHLKMNGPSCDITSDEICKHWFIMGYKAATLPVV